ncbi:hypothetical protein ZEAMMB73_Zm00001d030812 [Zea mays]|uniref:Uncharacterized protein n=1 Tax=Zea mays TaxID=4577 RepID=A0A1D6KEJ8_MAIZE|nr:hypothetical protein ZEAMMB73_Zm00001d030812 [Zea mays]
MASSTSSPWKPAPSPCSLPSRAPPAAMAELLFSPAVPCAQGAPRPASPSPWFPLRSGRRIHGRRLPMLLCVQGAAPFSSRQRSAPSSLRIPCPTASRRPAALILQLPPWSSSAAQGAPYFLAPWPAPNSSPAQRRCSIPSTAQALFLPTQPASGTFFPMEAEPLSQPAPSLFPWTTLSFPMPLLHHAHYLLDRMSDLCTALLPPLPWCCSSSPPFFWMPARKIGAAALQFILHFPVASHRSRACCAANSTSGCPPGVCCFFAQPRGRRRSPRREPRILRGEGKSFNARRWRSYAQIGITVVLTNAV